MGNNVFIIKFLFTEKCKNDLKNDPETLENLYITIRESKFIKMSGICNRPVISVLISVLWIALFVASTLGFWPTMLSVVIVASFGFVCVYGMYELFYEETASVCDVE